MKILYHHRTRSRDGQDVHITGMIRALRELGHEVVVVAPAAAVAAEFGDEAGAVAMLKRWCPQFVYELMELAYSFVVYWRLRRAILAHRPDVLYERYNLFLPAGVWASRRYKLPMLLEVNGPLYEERAANDGIALRGLARWSQRYAWRGADYVLPVTEALAKHVERYGVDRDQIVVIPNGIDPAEFRDTPDAAEAKRRLGLDGRLVLGFTGFVREWHGLDKVIALLAKAPAPDAQVPAAQTSRPQAPGSQAQSPQAPDVSAVPAPDSRPLPHLLIVGDGPARAKLEQQATAAGIGDRVTITGVVPRERIAAHIAAFDVALQPASVEYASPLKLFEYMALGRAIVAPAQPNIMEVLADGDNGLLFDPREPAAMGDAIERLCGDPALRERIGEAARKTIETRRLTWRDNAARVVALVAGMRGRGQPRAGEAARA